MKLTFFTISKFDDKNFRCEKNAINFIPVSSFSFWEIKNQFDQLNEILKDASLENVYKKLKNVTISNQLPKCRIV